MLETWIKQFETDDNTKITHSRYDYGKYCVPHDKAFDFLKKYSTDFQNKVPLHYIEFRGPVYKFMMDLDIYDKILWSNEDVLKFCSIVNHVINEFYDSNIYSIVARVDGPAKSKVDKDEKSQLLIHSGVHVIFPKLFITDETALLFRSAIIQYITKNHSEYAGFDLESILDDRIYKTNGFTMIGSTKKNEVRRYIPFAIIDKDGNELKDYLERILGDPLSMMIDTSISFISKTIIDSNPNGFMITKKPKWFDDSIVAFPTVKKKKSIKKSNFGTLSSIEIDIINKIIVDKIPVYKHEIDLIKGIYRYPDQNGDVNDRGALLITTNSRFCLNLGRDHHSCGIYFYAHKLKGIAQKCLCPCNTTKGRKYGLCSEFTSTYVKIPDDFQIILFGPEVKFRKAPNDVIKDSEICDRDREDEDNKDESKNDSNNKDEKSKPKQKKIPVKAVGTYIQGMTNEKKHTIDQGFKDAGTLLKQLINLEKNEHETQTKPKTTKKTDAKSMDASRSGFAKQNTKK